MTDLMSNIKKRMELEGVSQAELADALGRHRASVNKWFTRGDNPKTLDAVKIAQVLHTTVESLVFGEEGFDPAQLYIKKDPALRSIVIKLGLHPELVDNVDAYLTGYMDSRGYNKELDKKEA